MWRILPSTSKLASSSPGANVSLVSQGRILSFFSISLSVGAPHTPSMRAHARVHTQTHTRCACTLSQGSFSISIIFQSTLRPHHLCVGDGVTLPLVIWAELLNVMCLWVTWEYCYNADSHSTESYNGYAIILSSLLDYRAINSRGRILTNPIEPNEFNPKSLWLSQVNT